MASSRRARHARRPERRLRPLTSPTRLAVGGLVGVFTLASVLALHVMNVPSHLREEGVAGPAVGATRHSASTAHARATKSRAARSDHRLTTPTTTPTATAPSTAPAPRPSAASSTPAPAPHTSSGRPSPRPSPTSSSHRPLPLPTLSPRGRDGG